MKDELLTNNWTEYYKISSEDELLNCVKYHVRCENKWLHSVKYKVSHRTELFTNYWSRVSSDNELSTKNWSRIKYKAWNEDRFLNQELKYRHFLD